MNQSDLEQRIRQRLTKEGLNITPDSPADRGVKNIARVSADLANAGEQAVRDTRDLFNRAADAARDAIHKATKTPPPPPPSAPTE